MLDTKESDFKLYKGEKNVKLFCSLLEIESFFKKILQEISIAEIEQNFKKKIIFIDEFELFCTKNIQKKLIQILKKGEKFGFTLILSTDIPGNLIVTKEMFEQFPITKELREKFPASMTFMSPVDEYLKLLSAPKEEDQFSLSDLEKKKIQTPGEAYLFFSGQKIPLKTVLTKKIKVNFN